MDEQQNNYSEVDCEEKGIFIYSWTLNKMLSVLWLKLYFNKSNKCAGAHENLLWYLHYVTIVLNARDFQTKKPAKIGRWKALWKHVHMVPASGLPPHRHTKLLCVLLSSLLTGPSFLRSDSWQRISASEFPGLDWCHGPFPHPSSLLFCTQRIAPFIIPTDAWPEGRESQ